MTSVRPLRFVGAHALRAIELRVLSALLAWARDWLPEGAPQPLPKAQPAGASALAMRGEVRIGDAGRVWVGRSAAGDRALASVLVGAAAGDDDPVFEAACAEARLARDHCAAEALVGAHGEPSHGLPDAHLAFLGSGAVQIDCDVIGLHLLADEGVLRHVPPSDASRTALPHKSPLDRGLTQARLDLDVTLGSVELPLGSLLSMGRGDVLRLPLRLDGAAAVSIAGRPLARGRLGMHDGRRAVQLVALGDMEKPR